MDRSSLEYLVTEGEQAAAELYRGDISDQAASIAKSSVRGAKIDRLAAKAVGSLEEALDVLRESGMVRDGKMDPDSKRMIVDLARSAYASDLSDAAESATHSVTPLSDKASRYWNRHKDLLQSPNGFLTVGVTARKTAELISELKVHGLVDVYPRGNSDYVIAAKGASVKTMFGNYGPE